MTLSLNDENKNKVKTLLINSVHSHQVSIREQAGILGNIVASFLAFTFGPLHDRHLEGDKIRGLIYHKGNFERKICLSSKKYLKCTGGLPTLTIHTTILTTPKVLTLPYTKMLVLQVGELSVVYPSLKVSGI